MREGQERIPSGCAIVGICSRSGKRFDGGDIVRAIAVMHERSNGLGGGFAGYGIYPEHADEYALHLFYDDEAARTTCEAHLRNAFHISEAGLIPTQRVPGIRDVPLIWRYFARPKQEDAGEALPEGDLVARAMFHINVHIDGAYCFSCGKNMGAFKAVGYPEDVGAFYRLGDYKAHCWTAHGRYPTNTPGWWGGAHPFCMLDLSVVHNGEISSYDANRRAIEPQGYPCTLLTDTEVICYIFDYLCRRCRLTLQEAAAVVAAPFWEEIDRMEEPRRAMHVALRKRFPSLLITGPFSILVGFDGGMMALNDRLKLRSMVVGEAGDMVYVASEESAIRTIEPNLDRLYSPAAGEPVIVTIRQEVGV